MIQEFSHNVDIILLICEAFSFVSFLMDCLWRTVSCTTEPELQLFSFPLCRALVVFVR